MITNHPPALLDRALRLVVPRRDRDTVSGDLLEIYAEEKLPRLGPFRANLWYAQQILSILPYLTLSFFGGKLMKTISIAANFFLVLACSWFAVMELILKHPGFTIRAGIAAIIVLYAVLCIGLALAYTRIPSAPLRYGLSLFALATLVFGTSALITVLRAPHFEGYLLLVSLGLIAQGALTLLNTLQRPHLQPV